FSVRNPPVNEVIAELLAHIRHNIDLPVADIMNGTIAIPQDNHTEPNLFYQTTFAFNIHHVTHANLVFQQNKKAADNILHKVLRPKTNRQSHHSRAGQNRSNINTDLLQDHHPSE